MDAFVGKTYQIRRRNTAATPSAGTAVTVSDSGIIAESDTVADMATEDQEAAVDIAAREGDQNG